MPIIIGFSNGIKLNVLVFSLERIYHSARDFMFKSSMMISNSKIYFSIKLFSFKGFHSRQMEQQEKSLLFMNISEFH